MIIEIQVLSDRDRDSQMLIGLCGAEAVSKSAVSAAQGFLG